MAAPIPGHPYTEGNKWYGLRSTDNGSAEVRVYSSLDEADAKGARSSLYQWQLDRLDVFIAHRFRGDLQLYYDSATPAHEDELVYRLFPVAAGHEGYTDDEIRFLRRKVKAYCHVKRRAVHKRAPLQVAAVQQRVAQMHASHQAGRPTRHLKYPDPVDFAAHQTPSSAPPQRKPSATPAPLSYVLIRAPPSLPPASPPAIPSPPPTIVHQTTTLPGHFPRSPLSPQPTLPDTLITPTRPRRLLLHANVATPPGLPSPQPPVTPVRQRRILSANHPSRQALPPPPGIVSATMVTPVRQRRIISPNHPFHLASTGVMLAAGAQSSG
ncbi:hypothetical protein Slin15195_G129080 [Septoria linicola]|uniref:Uncharacterized protein n=1 Tax=Septoria linicola TaxID=215465 RepID=A0A9Q9B241_9PEZI|nr:hypothetical protein Slin14017_G121610 [Septoria linicola]USW59589.1 hypothetical protein Slin15195_G129080 [Septoria linicola]